MRIIGVVVACSANPRNQTAARELITGVINKEKKIDYLNREAEFGVDEEDAEQDPR